MVQRYSTTTSGKSGPGVWINWHQAAIVIYLLYDYCPSHYTGSDFQSEYFPTEPFDKPAVDSGMLPILCVDLNARREKKQQNVLELPPSGERLVAAFSPLPQGRCAIVSKL